MRKESLWNVSIVTSPAAEDAVQELLVTVLRSPAAGYHDFETGLVTINGYVPGKMEGERWGAARREIEEGLRRLSAEGLEIGPGKVRGRRLPATEWAEAWKRHFKPIEVGSTLLIRPSWCKRRARNGQSVVVLDPGLSFGTGQHPTTEFCLREIVRRAGSMRGAGTPGSGGMLDLGTGSGILAIAAAKLGCEPVWAYELDSDALEAAKGNARRNRVLERIQFVEKDVARMRLRPKRRFGLVCANLISSLLIQERARIVETVAEGGILVLAGILDAEFSDVRRAYEDAGLRLVRTVGKGEWRSGSFASE